MRGKWSSQALENESRVAAERGPTAQCELNESLMGECMHM